MWVVCEVQQQKHHRQDCTGDLHHSFAGASVLIVEFDNCMLDSETASEFWAQTPQRSRFTERKTSVHIHRSKWALFKNLQPVQLVWKVLAVHLQFVPQYAPPFVTLCLAGFQALKKGTRCSTPPICTAVRLLFVPQYASHVYWRYFWENTRGWGFRRAPEQTLPLASSFLLEI